MAIESDFQLVQSETENAGHVVALNVCNKYNKAKNLIHWSIWLPVDKIMQ